MTAKSAEEEEDTFDKVQVTTKTNKQLIFDDQSGRFFESSVEPIAEEESGSTSPYEVSSDVDVSNNEMLSTEVLFGRKVESTTTKSGDRFPHMDLVTDILVSDYAANNNNEMDDNDGLSLSRETSIVEQCYEAWNQRNMAAVVDCFDDNNKFEYQDSQYLGSITTKSELKQHFENQAKLLPPNSKLVLENIAVDPINGDIGAQWYVQEEESTKRVPFTRGCSFYKTNPENGLITSGFKTTEMVIKPSKQAADRLVSSASPFLQRQSTTLFSAPQQEEPMAAEPSSRKSIIETYFDAWNRRDMETALDCFVEDCVYQTEDPVFVGTFRGKESLRQHLEKNAATLPGSCRIVLDSIAQDPINGNIGTVWHLQVANGITIPNLRGCSMYTTDPITGLLKSGFDVTEAPVKVPRQFLSSPLALPARFLFGQ
ncbi:expressed unknown protein [Seminavis robusta]|uniref:SnoaL-like domain-containing protein n=1 Tax=Seminavis robusta TaxID=568900 RepID=A0A9N8HG65_9STRA|nr:expressed unknown protein [Seminavis robusta]|eukprot:Sro492_g153980.1 n/a (427) ;mRNA; f:60198-61478